MDANKKQVLSVLEDQKGNVTATCKSLAMPRSTFYNWCKEDPEFNEAVEEIREVALDWVESKLFEKINGVDVHGGTDKEGEDIVYKVPPSDTAIIFYLKTRGKKRGYVEKTEIDQNLSGGVSIIFEPAPNCDPIKDDYDVKD